MKLAEYLSEARGRQAALAKEIKAHAPDVSRWATGERPIPVEFCPAIERVTEGVVTRRDLRPDDWQRIWPELATEKVG
jgi:DNA-binding transcriptional regulator YdaS (Cro superfamily)